jgi:S-adenosylmethionine:tRNA ribosyltransferase-isomerase
VNPADFDYELPAALVAQQPLAERSASRLLRLAPGGGLEDLAFPALSDLLRAGDLLVVNDTRVIPARVSGTKRSGGRVEMLVERVIDERRALVQLRASHAPRPGGWLDFGPDEAVVVERREPFFLLEFGAPVMAVLARSGHVPLPPYIRRADEAADQERYQTVFAREPGAVAAPTAGLHFDAELLARLAAAGVGLARVTLHVGAGTFAPLRPAQIEAGRLHAERLQVGAASVAAIAAARAAGGRIVAVGTTVVRALETAARGGRLAPFAGETDLFITPGFEFRVADALVTNFHLPQSSLLMLVCAFGGTARVLSAYRHAVRNQYRFFSYGDAMFLERQRDPGGVP